MRKLVAAVLIGSMTSAAAAASLSTTRFVDARTGYRVESRTVASGIRLTGKHPVSGKTFELKVSRTGYVSGTWNGQPINFVLQDDTRHLEVAANGGAVAR